MTDPLIWTREDILRFTHEPDFYDRGWAWSWLKRHHLAEASLHASRAILDPYGSVASAGIAIFAAAPTSEARATIDELRRRTDLPTGVREALDELENPGAKRKIDDPIADAIERLAPLHNELRREAPAMLKSRDLDTLLVVLGALGDQQHQWATDLLLDALPSLVTRTDPTMLWAELDQLRDPRSLPALAAVWAPGDSYVATLYARIHHLSGATAALPPGIARDVAAEKARMDAIDARRNAAVDTTTPATRRVQIRCTACGRTGERVLELEKLPALSRYDGAEKKGRKAPRGTVFECAHCGVENAYELIGLAWIVVAGGLEELKKKLNGEG